MLLNLISSILAWGVCGCARTNWICIRHGFDWNQFFSQLMMAIMKLCEELIAQRWWRRRLWWCCCSFHIYQFQLILLLFVSHIAIFSLRTLVVVGTERLFSLFPCAAVSAHQRANVWWKNLGRFDEWAWRCTNANIKIHNHESSINRIEWSSNSADNMKYANAIYYRSTHTGSSAQ